MRTELDEARQLRIRDADLVDRLGRRDRIPSSGLPCVAAFTKKVKTYPTGAQQFYACSPLTVLGPEVEGGPGQTTAGSATFYALNLGSAVPPVGTNVLATFVESRWVFRYDG